MGTKIKSGQFDCYANALPDEPMFNLLARDPSAPALVSRWAAMRANDVSAGRRPPADLEMVKEAEACAHAMEVWRAANWPARKGETVESTTIGLADHDRRVTELLGANNREVERRRAAETALVGLKDFLAPFLADLPKLPAQYELEGIGAEVIRNYAAAMSAAVHLAGAIPPRCGDHVLHRPSGETWVVAYCEGNDLCAAGWPDGIARTIDCEVTHRATDDEHRKAVGDWLAGRPLDRRASKVARLYG